MHPAYLSLAITVPAAHSDALAALLDELGTLGAVVSGDDPVTYTAYFAGGDDLDAIARVVRARLAEEGVDPDALAIVAGDVPHTDWEAEWRRTLKPLPVGDRWLVRPSWISAEEPGRTTLVIDPKMAFGTGTHATTQLCLLELEALAAENVLRPGAAALDIGTGTGILAIAAAKLGARPVVAVEIDPVAIACAEENRALNGLSPDDLAIVTGMLDDVPPGRFDVILANIEFRTLVTIAKEIRDRLAPGGVAVFSGILEMERDRFVSAMRHAGWDPVRTARQYDPMTDDGWVSLVAR